MHVYTHVACLSVYVLLTIIYDVILQFVLLEYI